MTLVRASFPICSRIGAWLSTTAARVGGALALACCACLSTPVLAQSAFSADITFDLAPPEYQANQQVTVSINLHAGSLPITNLAFSGTLPAGVAFISPVAGACGAGTASSSGNTFQLSGGTLAADTSCSVILQVSAGPATTTTYTISLPLITYDEGGVPRNAKTSGSFVVDAGVPPTFSDSLPQDGYVGVPYFYFFQIDGTQPINVTITGLPPGLTHDPGSSEIFGSPTTAGTFSNVHVHATNGFPPDADATYTIVIHPSLTGTKTFAPASVMPGGTSTMSINLVSALPETMENVSFTDTFPAGMTGVSPGTTTQCGGTLTATASGLSFSGGTLGPGAACTITTSVRADTAASATLVNTTSQMSFELPADGPPIVVFVPPAAGSLVVVGNPPAITSAPPPNGSVGVSYSHQITVTGTTPITVTVTGLPPGLQFNAGPRTITGVPTQAGSFSGSIVASNGILPNAQQNFTIVVNAPPRITSGPPPNSTVGFVYIHQITVTGTLPIAITVSGLPPGLTYNAVTHTIGGTPTQAGNFPGSIVASNGIPPNAQQNYTIVIGTPPLVIVTNTLPPIRDGDNVSVPIVAQGGVPPYTFDLLSGQLPSGLAFDPQGLLKGVPTLPGTYTFTARVTDAVGTKATHTYTIVIAKGTPGLAFDLAPNPSVAGQAVVATATLTGAAGVAAGDVEVWLAQTGERCPTVAGSEPVAAKTVTSSLASGQVKFTFTDLGIDHYQVCATYMGDVRYNSVDAGPFDLFVIKGALLSAPSVAIAAPAEVKLQSAMTAQVAVKSSQASMIAPSGSVLLRADGVAVGTATLVNGVATFSTTAPNRIGNVTLVASYLGDGAFPPAVSAPALVDVKAGGLDPAPIPALSDLALIVLAASLAALGFAARRRR